MNYTYLKRGNILPSVGILQKLLNKKIKSRLVQDGIFGPHTEAAVKEFQRVKKIPVDGIVGEITWPLLVADINRLEIVDFVDVFDESLYNMELQDIKKAGGKPLFLGGMSNGIGQAIHDILNAAPRNRVFLLRFHGHGNTGLANISRGTGTFSDGTLIPGENLDALHTGNITMFLPIFNQLNPIFSPYGCIQFMHCSTGKNVTGRLLLSSIANGLRVPVTGALSDQLGGGISTFRYEGATYTALPGGKSLRTWCESLPDI